MSTRHYSRRKALRTVSTTIATFAATSPLLAQVATWTNTSGGNFQVTSNWNPVAIPSTTTNLLFNLNVTGYQVTFNGNIISPNVTATAGVFGWDAATVVNSFTVSGQVNDQGATIGINNLHFNVGTVSLGSGTVNFNSGTIASLSQLNVGSSATNTSTTLNMSSATATQTTGIIALGSKTGRGTAVLSLQNNSVYNASGMALFDGDNSGNSSLVVGSGSSMTAGTLIMQAGVQAGQTVMASVTGAGSTLTLNGGAFNSAFDVGSVNSTAPASFAVANSAVLNSPSSLPENINPLGTMTVTNSTWTANGNINVSGGALTVTGSTFNGSINQTITINAGGHATFDRLDLASASLTGPTINVTGPGSALTFTGAFGLELEAGALNITSGASATLSALATGSGTTNVTIDNSGVSAGEIELGVGGIFGKASTLNVQNGATLAAGLIDIADASSSAPAGLPTGVMNISGGSTASVSSLIVGDFGATGGRSGTVLVSGAGTALNVTATTGSINIVGGTDAPSTMTVTAGASLSSGAFPTAVLPANSLTISNATWNAQSSINISGMLNVTNSTFTWTAGKTMTVSSGGTATLDVLTLASDTINVTGSGSTLNVGALTVNAGAAVTASGTATVMVTSANVKPGGMITIATGSTLTGGNVTATGTTLTGIGPVANYSVNGFTLQNATFSGSGGTGLSTFGDINMLSASAITLGNADFLFPSGNINIGSFGAPGGIITMANPANFIWTDNRTASLSTGATFSAGAGTLVFPPHATLLISSNALLLTSGLVLGNSTFIAGANGTAGPGLLSAGNGNLTVDNGTVNDFGTITALGTVLLGENGTAANLTINGGSGNFGFVEIFAHSGTSNLTITGPGIASASAIFLLPSSGAAAAMTVSGEFATLNVTGSSNAINLSAPTGATSTLLVSNGGSVNTNGGGIQIGPNGVFTLNGGTYIGNGNESFNSGGTFNWISGQVHFTNSAVIGGGAFFSAEPLLGESLSLTPPRTLIVDGTTTLTSLGVLSLDGGTLITNSFSNQGNFIFNSGTLRFNGAQGVTLGAGGPLGSSLSLSAGKTLIVDSGATMAAGSLLSMTGGTFTAGSLNNSGELRLLDRSATVNAFVTNNKLIDGTGNITGVVANTSSGEIRVLAGDHLVFSSTVTNLGKFTLQGGGVFEWNGPITNSGQIVGQGTLLANSGLTNSGKMNFSSGDSSLFGVVNNTSGATVTISGNSTVTFYDPFSLATGTTLQVSTGSTAAFESTVTGGGGAFTGAGLKIFDGGNPNLSGPIATTTGSTTIDTAANLTSAGFVENALEISGTAHVTSKSSGAITSRVNSLSILDAGQLDLNDDSMILPYVGTSPVATIRAYLVSGFNQGNWNGAGINSMAAHNDPNFLTALGYTDNGSQVLVKYTYYGDNNLDGVVNTTDFQMLLDGLVATNASSWSQGDYTYDGKVDLGNDFDLFLAGYLRQGNALGDLAPIILDDTGLSLSQKSQLLGFVPEPAVGGFFVALACVAAGRRRRNSFFDSPD